MSCFFFFHHWHRIEPLVSELEYRTRCHVKPKATAKYYVYRQQCCRCGKIKRQLGSFSNGMEDVK